MNTVHFHLLLNHIPVLGTLGGLFLLAYASWRRSEDIKRAALWVFLIAAIFAIPTYLTGEPAEDAVKAMPGVTHSLIEQHEEVAAWALGGVLALGTMALGGLVWFRRPSVVPRWLGMVILAGALLVSSAMGWTANLGGQIRHTEIHANLSKGVESPAKPHHDDHE